MNLYRNISNKKLYTVEHLIYDMKHLNSNGFSGIYAIPYKWKGEIIRHYKEEQMENDEPFEPLEFFKNNFIKVTELRTLPI